MFKLQVLLVPPSARLVPGGQIYPSNQLNGNGSDGNRASINGGGHPSADPNGSYYPNSTLNGSSTPLNTSMRQPPFRLSNFPQSPMFYPPMNSFMMNSEASGIKKILHITNASRTIREIIWEIEDRFTKLYPQLEPLVISRVQDSSECDLDPDYVASMIFDQDRVIQIVLSNEFTPKQQPSDDSEESITETPISSLKTLNSSKRHISSTSEFVIPKKRVKEPQRVESIWAKPQANSSNVNSFQSPLPKRTNQSDMEVDEDVSNITLPAPSGHPERNSPDPKKGLSPRNPAAIMPGSPKRITSGMLTSHPDLSKNDIEDHVAASVTPSKGDKLQVRETKEAQEALPIVVKKTRAPRTKKTAASAVTGSANNTKQAATETVETTTSFSASSNSKSDVLESIDSKMEPSELATSATSPKVVMNESSSAPQNTITSGLPEAASDSVTAVEDATIAPPVSTKSTPRKPRAKAAAKTDAKSSLKSATATKRAAAATEAVVNDSKAVSEDVSMTEADQILETTSPVAIETIVSAVDSSKPIEESLIPTPLNKPILSLSPNGGIITAKESDQEKNKVPSPENSNAKLDNFSMDVDEQSLSQASESSKLKRSALFKQMEQHLKGQKLAKKNENTAVRRAEIQSDIDQSLIINGNRKRRTVTASQPSEDNQTSAESSTKLTDLLEAPVSSALKKPADPGMSPVSVPALDSSSESNSDSDPSDSDSSDSEDPDSDEEESNTSNRRRIVVSPKIGSEQKTSKKDTSTVMNSSQLVTVSPSPPVTLVESQIRSQSQPNMKLATSSSPTVASVPQSQPKSKPPISRPISLSSLADRGLPSVREGNPHTSPLVKKAVLPVEESGSDSDSEDNSDSDSDSGSDSDSDSDSDNSDSDSDSALSSQVSGRSARPSTPAYLNPKKAKSIVSKTKDSKRKKNSGFSQLYSQAEAGRKK